MTKLIHRFSGNILVSDFGYCIEGVALLGHLSYSNGYFSKLKLIASPVIKLLLPDPYGKVPISQSLEQNQTMKIRLTLAGRLPNHPSPTRESSVQLNSFSFLVLPHNQELIFQPRWLA